MTINETEGDRAGKEHCQRPLCGKVRRGENICKNYFPWTMYEDELFQHLTFRGPCIVIYSYTKTKGMH